MWGDELGKIDFRQKLGSFRCYEVQNRGGVVKLKLLSGQEGMADAVNANMAITVVWRASRAVIRIRNLLFGYLIACRWQQVFHGMGAFVDTIGCNHQKGHDKY